MITQKYEQEKGIEEEQKNEEEDKKNTETQERAIIAVALHFNDTNGMREYSLQKDFTWYNPTESNTTVQELVDEILPPFTEGRNAKVKKRGEEKPISEKYRLKDVWDPNDDEFELEVFFFPRFF